METSQANMKMSICPTIGASLCILADTYGMSVNTVTSRALIIGIKVLGLEFEDILEVAEMLGPAGLSCWDLCGRDVGNVRMDQRESCILEANIDKERETYKAAANS